MANRSDALLLWAPRVLGIALCGFLSLFGLDAFSGSKPLSQALRDFVVHVSPVLVLLGVVALSWRREWIAGVVFPGLAFTYAYVARGHLSWIPVISGPLLLVGVLFLVSWSQHQRLHARSG